jgi:hypothetical protein
MAVAGHGKVENGRLVMDNMKEFNQSDLTSDCWNIQIWGLDTCNKCESKGKKSCGGGATLKKLQKEAV